LKLLTGAVALVCLAMLAIAGTASAAETLYWDNDNGGVSPATIGFADFPHGTGGGVLSNAIAGAPGTDVEIDEPEGMAYDPANGRLYVAASGSNQILWVSTDGSGAGVLATGSAPVESPAGIAVDPGTQTVYWANSVKAGSIGYASVSGGRGGTLNTTGASIESPYKIALDTQHDRVYWIGGEGKISYANLDGRPGADLSPSTPAERLVDWTAIDVEPATNRLYVLGKNANGTDGVIWLSTLGVGGGGVIEVVPGAIYDEPYGLAFDPPSGSLYWANYGAGEDRAHAFGTTTGPGQPSALGIATAPVSGPGDPVVVRSPVGTAAPTVTDSGSGLSCLQGGWEPDYPGSYVYAAPLSYAYQWSKNGAPISGANGPSLVAGESGSYTCAVTASNLSGSATQVSAGVAVTVATKKVEAPPAPTPASLSAAVASKKAVKVKAGGTAVVPVAVANGGDTASGAAKVCATPAKGSRKGLVAPKCVTTGPVPAHGSTTAKLKVKALGSAKGTYKLGVTVNGKAATTVKVQVVAKKKPKKHRRVAKTM
jgi:hypothetical protein